MKSNQIIILLVGGIAACTLLLLIDRSSVVDFHDGDVDNRDHRSSSTDAPKPRKPTKYPAAAALLLSSSPSSSSSSSSSAPSSFASVLAEDTIEKSKLISSSSPLGRCMLQQTQELHKPVVAVGSNPVGTYICDYFVNQPGAVHDKSGQFCTIQCPLHVAGGSDQLHFNCQIQKKASSSQAKSASAWDFMVFHYGRPPVAPDPQRQMVVFYSGESNFTEAKRAKPEYQNLFHHVVSCHRTRRFYFTWTARFRRDFLTIAKRDSEKTQPQLRAEWHGRINAVALFVSRCGKGGRDKIIEAMRTSNIPIRSFGKCQRTHQVTVTHPDCVTAPAGETDQNGNKKGADRYAEKLCVFRKYRYVLALDNSHEEDYVTEKIYHAFIAGAVPIYLGAPNIADFVPTPLSFVPLTQWFRDEKTIKKAKESGVGGGGGGGEALFQMDQQIRNAPLQVLDFSRMKQELFDGLDKAADPSHEEESAAVYWIDSLLDWRRSDTPAKTEPWTRWSAAFWKNLHHREPTCDICNLALQRKCEKANS